MERAAAAVDKPVRGPRRPRRPLRPLSLWLRILLLMLGWLLVLVGVAGLVLPGIQGILTILAGATLLSLGSEAVYRGLRALLARWPALWRRMEGFRLRLHRRLARRRKPPGSPRPSPPGADPPPPQAG